MLNVIQDWRTVILLVLISLVIVAVLFLRPSWGASDISAFIGGIAVVLVAAMGHAQAAKPAPQVVESKPSEPDPGPGP